MKHATENPVIKKEFAARLKSLRRSAFLTQKEIASMIGVRRETYGEWENKDSQKLPSDLHVFVALCEILETTDSYLLRGLFEEKREQSHEKKYLGMYSRYRNNPDFFFLVGTLMELDDDYLRILAVFVEDAYSKLTKEKTLR